MKSIIQKIIWGILGLLMIGGLFMPGTDKVNAEEMPLPSPTETAPADIIITSGNYGYQVLNDVTNKSATLRKIYNYGEEVVIPSEIDGYKIISIGAPETSQRIEQLANGRWGIDVEKYAVFTSEDTLVKRLIIPEGVCYIQPNAFHTMKKLEELKLPQSMSGIYTSYQNIREDNFMGAECIKEINFPEEISVGGFEGSVIDKLIINGSFHGHHGDDYISAMTADVNTLTVKQGKETKRHNNIIDLGILGTVKNVVVDSDVKSLYMYGGKFENVTLKNSETEVTCDPETSDVCKITTSIHNIKIKKKKSKYEYSWKALSAFVGGEWYYNKNQKAVALKKDNEHKTKYIIYAKNKKGKYKKLKTISKTKIKLTKKQKIKVEVVCSEIKEK